MGDTVEQQMIKQLKKLQERLVALEANTSVNVIIDDLVAQIDTLKSEIAEVKKPEQRKLDFGEW